MSNVIDLSERLYAARIADLLYFAYESRNPAKIATAAALATKAIESGVTADEIAQAELSVMSKQFCSYEKTTNC